MLIIYDLRYYIMRDFYLSLYKKAFYNSHNTKIGDREIIHYKVYNNYN